MSSELYQDFKDRLQYYNTDSYRKQRLNVLTEAQEACDRGELTEDEMHSLRAEEQRIYNSYKPR